MSFGKRMKTISTPLTVVQSRAQKIFISALAFIGFLLLKPSVFGLFEKNGSQEDQLFQIVFWIVVLLLSFRGGQLALKMVKGCISVFAVMFAIIFIVIIATFLQGQGLPKPQTWDKTIEQTLTLIGVIFSFWALFISKSVKEFLAHQRKNP